MTPMIITPDFGERTYTFSREDTEKPYLDRSYSEIFQYPSYNLSSNPGIVAPELGSLRNFHARARGAAGYALLTAFL